MKKTIYYIFGALIVLNILAGFILSCYHVFNAVVSTIILILVAFLCVYVSRSSMKDGFKVSLLAIFPVVGLLQFFTSLFMPSYFTDNGLLLALIVTIIFEAIILIMAEQTSKHLH